jgi:hypothetical protein
MSQNVRRRRFYLDLVKKDACNGRKWAIYLPDRDSLGAVHLGRWRIDFGRQTTFRWGRS